MPRLFNSAAATSTRWNYTESCIQTFPEDIQTHEWLSQRAQQVETLLFETMIELMRKEELLDDSNQLALDKLSTRAREIAMKQVGGTM